MIAKCVDPIMIHLYGSCSCYNLIGGVQRQRMCVSRFGTSPPMSKPSMNALTLEFKHAILFLNVCLNNMMVDTSVYTGCRNVDTHIICVWCGTGQPLSELYLRVQMSTVCCRSQDSQVLKSAHMGA